MRALESMMKKNKSQTDEYVEREEIPDEDEVVGRDVFSQGHTPEATSDREAVIPQHIVVTESGERIDKFLASLVPSVSRQKWKTAIEKGLVTVDRTIVKAKYAVKQGEVIEVTEGIFDPVAIVGEDMALKVVYEDADIMVVDKEAGVITHPTDTIRTGTLVNALMHRVKSLSTLGGDERQGIVHRLDQNTTGLLVVAKTDVAYRSLVSQFQAQTVEKHYLCIVHGEPREDRFVIDAPIGRNLVKRKEMTVTDAGKPARSTVHVLERKDRFSLLDVEIHSGRTHQIRVHMKYEGFPVVGDDVYGNRKTAFRCPYQMLHAWRLAFDHPVTGNRLSFETRPHEEFVRIARVIGFQALNGVIKRKDH